MHARTFDIAYDENLNIARIEVFEEGDCIASRITHTPNELKRIGEDFESLNVNGLAAAVSKVCAAWEALNARKN